MLLIEVDRDGREQAREIVEQQISTEGQTALQNAKSAGVISEIIETVTIKVVKGVKPEVKQVGGVGVRIRGTEE